MSGEVDRFAPPPAPAVRAGSMGATRVPCMKCGRGLAVLVDGREHPVTCAACGAVTRVCVTHGGRR